MISAKIIADSISPQGHRITTFELVFPRMILAELNTHRLFSRNSASSRAIPFNKMVKVVQDNPFIPIAWQKEHKGMQGTEYASYPDTEDFKVLWLEARDNAVKSAQLLQTGDVKATKQLCNRLLEPFMYHKVLLTATEFDNFFELRCPQYHTPVSGEGFYFKSKKECIKNHSNPENIAKLEAMSDLEWLQINKGQSEIHMMALAECMYDAYNESIPKQLKAGEWHIPYSDNINLKDIECRQYYLKHKKVDVSYSKNFNDYTNNYYNPLLIQISTAKCARVSYTTVGEDGKEIPYEKDIALHDSLLSSGHMSPFEHCARVMSDEEYYAFFKGELSSIDCGNGNHLCELYTSHKDYKNNNGWCLNYRGWIQYRYLLENE
jgi:thymidylate synthase ThyX